jgi:hypothetical protein
MTGFCVIGLIAVSNWISDPPPSLPPGQAPDISIVCAGLKILCVRALSFGQITVQRGQVFE